MTSPLCSRLLALASVITTTVVAGSARAQSAPAALPPAATATPTATLATTTLPPVTLPTAIDAPQYPPPSARWKVVGTGVAVGAAWYGAAAGMSYLFPDAPGAVDLRTPLIGPWRALANNGCAADEPDCSQFFVILRGVLTVLDGVGQAASIPIVLEGLFMPTREVAPRALPVLAPSAPQPPDAPASPPQEPGKQTPAAPPAPNGGTHLFYVPLPMTVGERGVGVGVIGRF